MNAKDTVEDFEFFVPMNALTKAQNIGDSKDSRRLIEGIASTDDIDLQGEKVVQSGIDTSYFMKYGYINDDHKPGPEHKVGEPVECRATKAGLWIRAFLYKGNERAEHWWEMMNNLEGSGATRKVGFSIQGKILRRSGTSILKCWLQDIAITASPVNIKTWAEIVKSLSTEKWCIHPWKSLEKACKGCPGNAKCSTSIPAMMRKKEEEKKALSVGAGGMGRNLVPQSLEGKTKVQTFKSNDHITHAQAVKYLHLKKGYSVSTACAVADAIFVAKGVTNWRTR